MSERYWFFIAGQTRQGPIAENGLRQSIAAGSIPATTLVWTEGMPQWQPVCTIGDFAVLFQQPAGSLPPLAGAPMVPLAYAPLPPQAGHGIGDDLGMRMLLPVGRSGWAIASGYLGLLSVIPIVGVFALITGILAVIHMRRNPKVHGLGRAIFGMVMGGGFTLFYLALFLVQVFRDRL